MLAPFSHAPACTIALALVALPLAPRPQDPEGSSESTAALARLRAVHEVVPTLESCSDVEVGDLTGDGLPDLVAHPLRLLVADGSGAWVEYPDAFPVPQLGWGVIDLGDFDGDGDLDVFETHRLFWNDGHGAFQQAAGFPAGTFATTSSTGDIDGDGLLDLATGGQVSKTRLIRSLPGGQFSEPFTLPVEARDAGQVELVDVDSDGDLDLLHVDESPGNPGAALVLINTGGTFAVGSVLPHDGYGLGRLGLGDLDGDGDVDLYAPGYFASGAYLGPDRLYLNDGSGTFAPAAIAGSPSSDSVLLADLDGDSDLDALAYGRLGDTLLLNDGAGLLTPAVGPQIPIIPSNSPLGVIELQAQDLDGDGDLDAVAAVAVGQSGPLRILLNQGSGVLTDVTHGAAAPPEHTGLVLRSGDLDGDGDPDAVLGCSDRVQISWNAGSGTFGAPEDLWVSSASSFSYVMPFLVDLDGDGDLDVYAGADGGNELLLNDGLGGFTNMSALLPAGLPKTTALATGDLDGDGTVDAYLGGWGPDGLLLGDGAGGFTYEQASLPPPPGQVLTARVALGDLDGDGDLDVLAKSASSLARVSLAINQGGVFVDGSSLLPPQPYSGGGDLELGDIDGDGDLDVIVGTGKTIPYSETAVWINQGGLQFELDWSRIPLELSSVLELELGDVDGDGDLDLFEAVYGNLVVTPQTRDRLLLNDGKGFFVPSSGWLPEGTYENRWARFVDSDGDSDLDLVSLRPTGLTVLHDHAHQLAWEGLPRAGEPTRLRVSGAPGEHWILVAARRLQPGFHGLGALGERRTVATGTLPPSGEELVMVPDFDQTHTLWRVVFTGPDGRALGNVELTDRFQY